MLLEARRQPGRVADAGGSVGRLASALAKEKGQTRALPSLGAQPAGRSRFTYCFLPGAGRSSAAPMSSSQTSSWSTQVHVSSSMSAAYSLENWVISATHAPA